MQSLTHSPYLKTYGRFKESCTFFAKVCESSMVVECVIGGLGGG